MCIDELDNLADALGDRRCLEIKGMRPRNDTWVKVLLTLKNCSPREANCWLKLVATWSGKPFLIIPHRPNQPHQIRAAQRAGSISRQRVCLNFLDDVLFVRFAECFSTASIVANRTGSAN